MAKISDKAQVSREKVVEMEATIRQIAGQNDRLESDLLKEATRSAELSAALEEQKAYGESLQREFETYKGEHKISGDLRALQSAVTALQKKLDKKSDE